MWGRGLPVVTVDFVITSMFGLNRSTESATNEKTNTNGTGRGHCERSLIKWIVEELDWMESPGPRSTFIYCHSHGIRVALAFRGFLWLYQSVTMNSSSRLHITYTSGYRD